MMNIVDHISKYFEYLKNNISRSRLALRLMGVDDKPTDDSAPGLVIIQIDGLSFSQIEQALSRKRLPFLQSLVLDYDAYHLMPMYAGVPSTTPAVQAELFFGVKAAVPAFEFIDRRYRKRRVMFYADSAAQVADELMAAGHIPLLKNGTSYSNIYAGGADEARYCAETMRLESLFQSLNPLKFIVLALLHIVKVLRVLGVSILEFFIAVKDFFQGVMSGKNFIKELKFIPSRVFVCIVLRELIRFRVKMDVARGVPIIHANFTGYDEQAHRRGPASGFAHWTLKGIDWVIGDIYQAAGRSEKRDYRLMFYSDHGQETVRTYGYDSGRDVKQAVKAVYAAFTQSAVQPTSSGDSRKSEYRYSRARQIWTGIRCAGRRNQPDNAECYIDDLIVTTMGPLGHVYLPQPMNPPELAAFSRLLVEKAKIPLVLFKIEQTGGVMAMNQSGVFELKKEPAAVLGDDHPFLAEAAEDLGALCFHPHAGDVIISGWSPKRGPRTFSIENGAHGGPGREETRGFALLPRTVVESQSNFVRPLDLRSAAFSLMKGPGRAVGTDEKNSAKWTPGR